MEFFNRQQVVQEALQLYNPYQHDVFNQAKRPNKQVQVRKYTGKLDKQGKQEYITENKTVQVSRIPLDFVRYGAEQKSVFAVGAGVELIPNTENSRIFEQFKQNWEDIKIEYELVNIHTAKQTETQVAVIFRFNPDKRRLDYRVVSPSRGDVISVNYDDETGDLIEFTRQYLLNEDSVIDRYYKDETGIYLEREIDNEKELYPLDYPDLPIVYWEQGMPEFWNSKPLIDLLESGFSDFAEACKYFANQIMFVKGTDVALPEQQQQGKVIFSTGDGDAKFLENSNPTQQNELLFKTATSWFFMQSRVAPLSFEQMAELGAISGVALDKILVDSQIGATLSQVGDFGKGVQRLVNFMVKFYQYLNNSEKDLRVKVQFNKYSMEDESEKISARLLANGGKPVESVRTSMNKLGINADEEIERINNENTAV